MTDTPLTFASDFADGTQQDWESQVLKVLNRKRPEDRQLDWDQAHRRLETTTIEGLTIQPFYPSTQQPASLPGAMPFTRGVSVHSGRPRAWDVCQLLDNPDVATSRKDAVVDLENGATSLMLRIDPDAIAPGDVSAVLADVIPSMAAVSVYSTTDQGAAAQALAAWWTDSDDPDAVTGNLGIDPLALAALNGDEVSLEPVMDWARRCGAAFPRARALTVDTTVYHNAGASDVQELAYAIATGVEYLRVLTDQGFDAGAACGQIEFRVSATTDQFTTICRLRALRRLWARVTEVCGVTESKRGAIQHAVTSYRNLSRDDPYNNMLRGTIAAFSAAVGGAERITVLPFDTIHGISGEFSRRMARNTQLIAMEESNIGRVADPAGGSAYVEEWTNSLATAAWDVFQHLEAWGGMAQCVFNGRVAEQIAESQQVRATRIADRQQPITGVSMFPAQHESELVVTPRAEAPVYRGLVPVRDSQPYEQLRDRADEAREVGTPPLVFLACLGTRRDYGPREGFASNVLLAGGIDMVRSDGGTTQDIVAQVHEAGAAVVVMCSSASQYAEQAVDLASALKDASVNHVLLAGSIKETRDDKASDVIDGTIYSGMNVIEFLTQTLDQLGVAK